ncbi:MAG: DNA-processing protein DprA [Phycisphaerales bacterium JB039]
MPPLDDRTRDLLRLTLIPGLGPVRIARLVEHFQEPGAVLRASPQALQRIRGLGEELARAIAVGVGASGAALEHELELMDRFDVSAVAIGTERYPPLLAEIPAPPPILYVRGSIDAVAAGSYPVAIVGSRRCTAYGIEQAERFAGGLARAGLPVVSGGARGIDTAAHRGALRSGGVTVAVLGCGLSMVYPEDNVDLFAAMTQRGCLVSELPMRTAPEAKNFPARNRIISGLALGTLVIEAGRKSGALITARRATDEQNREVMVVPGRVDSAASEGSLEMLKAGAHLVTSPADVLEILETSARHSHAGTFADRYANPGPASATGPEGELLAALDGPMSIDDLAARTGRTAASLLASLTVLEITGRVRRQGAMIHRRGG